MRLLRLILFPVMLVSVVGHVYAAPFALFPKAGHLASPDGRFEVRDVDLREPGSEFSGIFHSLWLVETASGRSRKLCDYVGVAAVAWSEKDSLMVTQYLSKKTSRALIFATTSTQEPVVLDVPSLIQMVPVGLRPALREMTMPSLRLHGWRARYSTFRYGDTVSMTATAFTGIANTNWARRI